MLGELLTAPIVTIARSVEANGESVEVVRVAPDGEETVEAAMPVVVTISNELGEPRYPTMKAKMQARKRAPTVVTVESLDVPSDELVPTVVLVRQFVPEIAGDCAAFVARPAHCCGPLTSRAPYRRPSATEIPAPYRRRSAGYHLSILKYRLPPSISGGSATR